MSIYVETIEPGSAADADADADIDVHVAHIIHLPIPNSAFVSLSLPT